jgi:hypothetical protein
MMVAQDLDRPLLLFSGTGRTCGRVHRLADTSSKW